MTVRKGMGITPVIFPTTFRVSEEDLRVLLWILPPFPIPLKKTRNYINLVATTKNRLMVFSPTMENKQRFQPYDGQTPRHSIG